MTEQKNRRWLIPVLVTVILIVAAFLLINGEGTLSRSSIRFIRVILHSFGNLSPLVVVFLVTLSTIVPPLPLPIPVVEIAAGIAFGFMPGFLIVWISQIISSLIAFHLSRKLGQRLFGAILGTHLLDAYRSYLTHRGAWAVFYIRLILAAPFNVISFMAGLSQMKSTKFILATALGTIPEALLFTYLGSQIRTIRPNLWYISAALIILGAFGLIVMLTMNKTLDKKD